MQCRAGCGACCIAPSINQAFYGMPHGKKAGQACVHLDNDKFCQLFNDERRPQCCHDFTAEHELCLSNADEALQALTLLEVYTRIE